MSILLALDLDYTLIRPVCDRRWEDILAEDIFAPLGIPEAAARDAYAFAYDRGGVGFAQMTGYLNSKGYDVSAEEAEQTFLEWLTTGVELYPDAAALVAAAREGGIPIAIVTAGHPVLQKQKAEAAQLPTNLFFAVSGPEHKAGVLEELYEKQKLPIVFVDDLPIALDTVYDKGLADRVTPVRIRRGPHEATEPRFPHIEIADLRAVLDILRKHGVQLGGDE